MIELESTRIRNKISILCDFYEDLLNRYELIFREGTKETHLQEIKEIMEQIISSKTFSLAFVGEYNSGKTSIINILTGEKLAESSTVETDKSTEIPWNNITIIDTPGLGSGREEHDNITKEWLAKADLLLYVLTPDLLTTHGGKRLLNMLDVYKRDHEMMIIVNMIDQEGNDISSYRQDLQKLLDPRPLDSYAPVFMSAKYKRESLSLDMEEEDREYFLEKSRFDIFVISLNKFILNRREKAALTTPLTRLQTLSWKIAFKNKFDEECALLDLNIENHESALRDLKAVFDDFKGELKDVADGTTGNIFLSLDTAKDIKGMLDLEIKSYISKLPDSVASLADRMSRIAENLQVEHDRIDNSDLGIKVKKRIETSETLKKIFNVDFSASSKESKTSECFTHLNKVFEGMDLGSGMGKDIKEIMKSKSLPDLTKRLIGAVDKNVILKAGHLIGHKFKPWQAIKFAKAVPFINIAAVGFELLMAIRKKGKAEEDKKKLREFKEDINSWLKKTVEETQETVKRQMLVPVEAIIITGMSLLKDKKKKLIEFSEQNKDLALQIENKREECMKIYDEIYGGFRN